MANKGQQLQAARTDSATSWGHRTGLPGLLKGSKVCCCFRILVASGDPG